MCVQSLSRVWLFAALWTVACQAPLSLGFSRQEILEWVAIPFSRGSPDPGTEPGSPALQADSLKSEPPGKPLNFSVLSQGWGEGEWRRKKEGKGLEAKKKLDVI